VDNLRGQAIKQENLREIIIERKFLTKSYFLRLNKDLCNGCGICFEVCPHEAIKELPSTVYEGHLIEKPTIDLDAETCILCGECAVLCPLSALTMEVDGKETSTIVENEAFPILLKEVTVMKEKCSPECGLKCQEACPTEALKVSTKNSENGEILEITDVQINESSCLYCRRCELACDQDAVVVQKPFMGRINLNADVCPQGCVACVDICPTHAIQIENGKPKVSDEFCIYCSACEKVCPNEAITVYRDWIFHTDVTAAAWLTALKKLTSAKTVAKELRIKSRKRRVHVVQARAVSSHSNSAPPACTRAEEFLKILNNCKRYETIMSK
jgi:4Fe-4S ferredoxin